MVSEYECSSVINWKFGCLCREMQRTEPVTYHLGSETSLGRDVFTEEGKIRLDQVLMHLKMQSQVNGYSRRSNFSMFSPSSLC